MPTPEYPSDICDTLSLLSEAVRLLTLAIHIGDTTPRILATPGNGHSGVQERRPEHT